MKNSKIHLGLENSDLRDFLSILIVKNFEQDSENKKQFVKFNPENPFEREIKDCENEINFHSKRLQILNELQAIMTLIKMQGWKEFDVSDKTEHDLQYKLSMNFIGTESEYDNFISTIDK